MATYSDLLGDPRWQRKRLSILLRDEFTCVLCDDSRSTLHVHHTEYNGNPWDISDEKLKTVCLHCHTIIHALPRHEIEIINKKISLNAKCWECVVITATDIVFLYLFFSENKHTDKCEVITVFPNDQNKAA